MGDSDLVWHYRLPLGKQGKAATHYTGSPFCLLEQTGTKTLSQFSMHLSEEELRDL